MRYAPNAEGAAWFLERVWPQVSVAVPDARFRVVGPGSDTELERFSWLPGVELCGVVDDLAPHLRSATVSVAPLLAGSGTRVKIIEAFAWGVPVVSTTVGAEGLEAEPGRDLLVADDPAAFADHVIDLLTRPGRRASLAAAGRQLYRLRYSPLAFRAAADTILDDVLPHLDGASPTP